MTDKQLLKTTTQFIKGFLGNKESKNMCFMLSTALQGFLSICGIKTELVEGELDLEDQYWEHYWLELPDGRILDPTADQFKTPDGKEMPRVFLGEKPEWYKIMRPKPSTIEKQAKKHSENKKEPFKCCEYIIPETNYHK